jgi:hypothetical protein
MAASLSNVCLANIVRPGRGWASRAFGGLRGDQPAGAGVAGVILFRDGRSGFAAAIFPMKGRSVGWEVSG